MKLHKRILNQDWAQNAVAALAMGYLRFVKLTSRWELRGWDNAQRLIDAGTPTMICFWHGRLMANIFAWPEAYTLHQLSTAHRDGKLAGKTYSHFNVVPVWLESKSPLEATRKLVKILKSGGVCALTPDGPKGPRQRMQTGAIDIARMAGAKLIPVSNSGTNIKVLGTWDRMHVPLPFGSGATQLGEPIEVPRHATAEELEAIRQKMEDTLNAMTRALDAEFGQVTPEPAPLPQAEDAA